MVEPLMRGPDNNYDDEDEDDDDNDDDEAVMMVSRVERDNLLSELNQL